MIGLGLACSHAAGLFRPPEVWQEHLKRAAPGVIERYPAAQQELASLERCQELHRRIHACFAQQRAQIAAYKPDAIILIGDDQADMFNLSNNPAIAIYTGAEPMWGRTGYEWDKPTEQRSKVVVQNHVELSQYLLRSLVKKNFDVANMARFQPAGRDGHGLSHMAARIAPELDPSGTIPVICVFLNEYFAPMPSGERCAQLGRAIAEAFADRPERIAICASGGLSHYPSAKDFNRGDIDVPLDTWVLERIQRNDVAALEHLFSFDSQALRSGTGEIRAWISVAAAMNRPGTVLDYMTVFSTFTGAGFVSWPELPEQTA
jgi:hypothetical protein